MRNRLREAEPGERPCTKDPVEEEKISTLERFCCRFAVLSAIVNHRNNFLLCLAVDVERRKSLSNFVLTGRVPWAFSPPTRSVGTHALGDQKQNVDTRIISAQDELFPRNLAQSQFGPVRGSFAIARDGSPACRFLAETGGEQERASASALDTRRLSWRDRASCRGN